MNLLAPLVAIRAADALFPTGKTLGEEQQRQHEHQDGPHRDGKPYYPTRFSADHSERVVTLRLVAARYTPFTRMSDAALPAPSTDPAMVTARGARPAITSGRSVWRSRLGAKFAKVCE